VALVPILLKGLTTVKMDPFARVSLLKILNVLFLNSSNQKEMIEKYHLRSTIKNIVDTDEGVIVTQVALQLLNSISATN
jgi:hypothetical protein